VIGVCTDNVARGCLELLNVQSAAWALAEPFQAILGLEPNDDAQEVWFVNSVVVQQRRVWAGHRRHLHLADAKLCTGQ
jgi:hypothetical protein